MATIYNQVLLHWLDKNGKPGTSFWTTLDQSNAVPGGLSSLGAAAQALSTCGLLAVQYQTTAVIGNAPTTGAYQSIFDRAVLLAEITGTNQPTRFEIPGPVASILLADTVTIDLANTLVTAFAAQAQGNCGDKSGHAVGPFIRGRRTKARGAP